MSLRFDSISRRYYYFIVAGNKLTRHLCLYALHNWRSIGHRQSQYDVCCVCRAESWLLFTERMRANTEKNCPQRFITLFECLRAHTHTEQHRAPSMARVSEPTCLTIYVYSSNLNARFASRTRCRILLIANFSVSIHSIRCRFVRPPTHPSASACVCAVCSWCSVLIGLQRQYYTSQFLFSVARSVVMCIVC